MDDAKTDPQGAALYGNVGNVSMFRRGLLNSNMISAKEMR
jgi:hypothetical protein